jgi:iron-sulfur cluster assembly accessory protein
MELTITRAAARFMRMMILADGGTNSGFRLSVSPGGCAGLSADIAVASAPAPGEKAVVVEGIRLFLDAQSRMLLQGVTVDFVDSMSSQGLVFHDPRHVATCATMAAE